MSLVFSALVPHSPILIPVIGKENLNRLKKTKQAYEQLALDLAMSGADTIIAISPHGPNLDNTFLMNLNPQFIASFQDFGDLSIKTSWPGNIGLTHRIREKLETSAPLKLMSEEKLDYSLAVPLYLLTEKLPNVKIIPLYYSSLDLPKHFEFGKLLGQEIIANHDQIAVLASGDLSHCLTKNAPGGYRPKSKKFDKKIIDYLQNNKVEEIFKINQAEIDEAQECGLRSIVILLGILEGVKNEPILYSYEAPFGIGYLVMNFKL